MSFETPNPNLERKSAERDRNQRARQRSIQEAIRTFFGNAREASKDGACLNCGSTTDLKAKATVSLPETGETWEISLPLCERCVWEEIDSAARSDYESTELADCVTSEVRNEQ